jgi:hypothetical protein
MTLLSRFGEGASGNSALPAFTWATKPAAADYSGRLIRISDVGVNGSLWFSDGTRWVHDSPIILQQASKGWIVPSLAAANAATYEQTGTTITVTSAGHNIPATVHNGKDVYLAIASGDAVAGWYSNFTSTGVDTFTCESTVSQTTSGTVNTNTAETTVSDLTKNILGGLMGANGSLQYTVHSSVNVSGNLKILRVKFGNNEIMRSSTLSSTSDIHNSQFIVNINPSKQVFRNRLVHAYEGVAISSTPAQYLSVDTDTDVVSSITLQSTAANEFMAIEAYLLEGRPS